MLICQEQVTVHFLLVTDLTHLSFQPVEVTLLIVSIVHLLFILSSFVAMDHLVPQRRARSAHCLETHSMSHIERHVLIPTSLSTSAKVGHPFASATLFGIDAAAGSCVTPVPTRIRRLELTAVPMVGDVALFDSVGETKKDELPCYFFVSRLFQPVY